MTRWRRATRQWSGVLVVALGLAGALSLAAVVPERGQQPMNALTEQEKVDGWRLVFDGKTTAGWRGFRKTEMPAGWQAVDGALSRVGPGGDIITVDQFESFELAFEWKVAPGGNSGVFFGVSEDVDAVWQTAPEYQILDNVAHRDGLKPETSAGSNYALHAPTRDVTRPAGAWNGARIVVRGAHVEHWLNGERIVEYELGSPDWTDRVAKSKFNDYPNYGRIRRGHLGLQDHGDPVAYRNMKIRLTK